MNQKKDIYYFLEKACKNNKQNEKLLSVAENIVSEVKNHLKQISYQMPGYDIHDEEHSENVIKIMGYILAGKLESLSFYELILLYLAAYLHDSGMALPAWEYEALKSVEGCGECHEKGLKFFIGNDFKPIQDYDTVKKLVEKVELFNYDPKDYIGLKAGDFVHTFGDAHIYTNHIEQVKLQLTREPRPLPQMRINPAVKDLFDFKFEDFELTDYNPWPHIAGEVAV